MQDSGRSRKEQGFRPRIKRQKSPAVSFGRAVSLPKANKKRPKLFSSGRLGSPPPELPNHDWIVGAPHKGVNVTSVTRRDVPVTLRTMLEVIENWGMPLYFFCQDWPASLVVQVWWLAVVSLP